MGTDLTVIGERLQTTIGYVKNIIGEKVSPVPITDEKALNSALENVVTLKDIKKAVEDYFKPLKVEAKKPYEDLLNQEKEWLGSINDITAFVDTQIRVFNDKRRAELLERERKEAEERSATARAALEAQKAEAEAAGNTEMAAQLEQEKQNTVVGEVAERKMMNRSELSTMSESETIEDFIILNHPVFASALMESGNQAMIVLDKKVETAFKKYLLTNREIKAFPGIRFRRDYRINHRTKQ